MINWKETWSNPTTITHKEIQELIDQTREETIRDLLSSVQENRDEFFKGENDRGRLYYNGLIDLFN